MYPAAYCVHGELLLGSEPSSEVANRLEGREDFSLGLPGVDLGNEAVRAFNAAIETLAFEHADLDLDHVEPACMLGGVVELEPPEHAARLGRREGDVESGGGVGGEVVEDDADVLGFWEVDIDKLAHAKGEVVSGAMIRDLDPAPRAMGVKIDADRNALKQIEDRVRRRIQPRVFARSTGMGPNIRRKSPRFCKAKST
jgi:hypothetical protein